MRLLVVADDKIGRRAAARVAGVPNLTVLADRSHDWRRGIRLLLTRRMRVSTVARMALAEWRREGRAPRVARGLGSNRELLALVDRGFRTIYLFRAGLIVNRDVLQSGAEILNMHCARLPEYGGLAAIERALHDAAYEQAATLHRVTRSIDAGDIVATRSFRLDPARSYRVNEDVAYDAGIDLLLEHLQGRT